MPSSRTGFIDAETILKPIREAEKANQAIAYDKYNADYYNSLIQPLPSVMDLTSRQYPDATYVSKPDVIGLKQLRPTLGGKRKKTTPASYGDGQSFVNDIYSSYYRAVRPGAASDADAKRQARFLTQKAAYETGYGDTIYAQHNYGGHEVSDGKGGVKRLQFNSMDDFTKADVKLLDKKWGNWRNAKSDDDFVTAITTDNGYGRYNAVNSDYRNTYKGMTKRVNNYLNNGRRPKAWVGAAIGAASSILGSIFSSNSQERLIREQMEEQRRLREHDNALKTAQSLTQSLNLQQDAQREYENRFRINYSNGGRRKLRDGVSITDGGYGIPIDYNTFLLRGGSHEDVNETGQTGIGLKVGGKEIEAEGGEVVQKTPTELRVFSDSIILPNGMTPAEAVEAGGNKTQIFNIQQNMNGDYGIRSKRRLRNGGCLSHPVERIKARPGLWATLKDAYNWTADQWRKFEEATTPESVKNNPYILMGDAPSPGTRGVSSAKNLAKSTMRAASKTRAYTPRKTRMPMTDYTRRYLNEEPTGVIDNTASVVSNLSRNIKNGISGALALGGAGGLGTLFAINSDRDIDYNSGTNNYNPGTPYTLDVNYNLPSESTMLVTTPYRPVDASRSMRVGFSGLPNTGAGIIADEQKSDNTIVGNLGDYWLSSNGQPVVAQQTAAAQVNVEPPIDKKDAPKSGSTSGRRRLRSRGAAPVNIGSFNVPKIESPYKSQDTGIDMEAIARDMNPYQGLSDREITSRELGFGSATAPTSGTTTPAPVDYTSNTNRFGVNFKGADWIQLGADLFSSIYSGINQANMADYIEDPVRPALLAPAKLITNYNIAPRLQTVANSRLSMLRDSDEAVSSAARNARRNQINLATNQAANELWGEKTNKEVELLNTDALNQQGIHKDNVLELNKYYRDLAEARMRRGLMRAQGRQALFSGIGDAVGNLIDQGKQRYSDQQAMAYYTALLPEEGRRWLRRNGVDFLRRGGKIS